jgi:hypothetical protein
MFVVDYEENPILTTTTRSATLCARSNQNKSHPFKLEILIGAIEFTYHPQFTREDMLLSDMRYLIKRYRYRTNLALLPHLKKIKDILTKELHELQNRPDFPKKEIQNIKDEYDRMETQFNEEKELLQKLMS